MFHRSLNARPAGSRQHDHRDLTTREVLLISQILVGRDQNRKAALFGFLQQFTVFQIVPTKLKGRRDLMDRKVLAKWDWSTLVEKNTHLRRFEGAGGVLKHGADLRERHARKPVDKV